MSVLQKYKWITRASLLLGMAAAFLPAGHARATLIQNSSTAPALGPYGFAQWQDRSAGQYITGGDYTDHVPAIGQSFTTPTGQSEYSLNAITIEMVPGSGGTSGYQDATTLYSVVLYAVSGTTLTQLHRWNDEFTFNGTEPTGIYLTFNLADPQVLQPGSPYAFQVFKSSGAGWLGWDRSDYWLSPYAGGMAFQATATSSDGATTTMSVPNEYSSPGQLDRSFAVTLVPEPGSLALLGLGALMAMRRRRRTARRPSGANW